MARLGPGQYARYVTILDHFTAWNLAFVRRFLWTVSASCQAPLLSTYFRGRSPCRMLVPSLRAATASLAARQSLLANRVTQTPMTWSSSNGHLQRFSTPASVMR